MSSKVKTSGKGSLGSLEENLKKLKPMLNRRFKVKRLGIFGSYVRGQAHRRSDVDVLVEFSGGIDLLDFVALERYLRDRTGAKIDLVSIKALRPEFRDTILNEVIYI
ncbi:hypothetical protein ES703_97451 [subsurface metagenome]